MPIVNPLSALTKLLSTDADFSQEEQVKGKVLTATSYDEKYYQEHLAAGLDYLGHGFWHDSYAAMVSEATLQATYPDPFVVDGGCACGSILKGFKD